MSTRIGGVQEVTETGLRLPEYDYAARTEPDATSDLWTFKIGGAGGVTVCTVTVVYVDSDKDAISTITRTPHF